MVERPSKYSKNNFGRFELQKAVAATEEAVQKLFKSSFGLIRNGEQDGTFSDKVRFHVLSVTCFTQLFVFMNIKANGTEKHKS